MANEKKTQDPTVEFILRTANAETEADMRALVVEMLEHSAGTDGDPEGDPEGNAAVDAIMSTLKSHGGDIATLAAPLVGAGIAGRGNRLRGAGIGAGVGLGVNAAATAAEAPGFSVGLQVLARLANAMTRSKAPKDSKKFSGESDPDIRRDDAEMDGTRPGGGSNGIPGEEA